jgi:hypothetical protein
VTALKKEIKELRNAQEQVAHSIASFKSAEQESPNRAPSAYWYSSWPALRFGMESRPERDGIVSRPPR